VTVQPEDIEPETGGAARASAPAPDWRADPNFRWPARVPWSELVPSFMDNGDGGGFSRGTQPEHMEIVGPSGSGKTHLMLSILQGHYRDQKQWAAQDGRDNIRQGAVLIVTKADDDIFRKLGWPVLNDMAEVRRGDTNFVFWPRTSQTGLERRAWHDDKLTRLLGNLLQPKANTVTAFDEIGYAESLSGNMRALIQQFWREGRSHGITVVGMKQRPQGALRDMHSETPWTAVFKPKDRSDAERFAELLGHRRDWLPVLDNLDRAAHEFVLRHSISEEAFITWVDTPLEPQKIRRKGLAGMVGR
jgi:hypothetical protein